MHQNTCKTIDSSVGQIDTIWMSILDSRPLSNNIWRSNKACRVDSTIKVSLLHFGNSETNFRRYDMKDLAWILACVAVSQSPWWVLYWYIYGTCCFSKARASVLKALQTELQWVQTPNTPLWVQANNFSCIQRTVSAAHKKDSMLYTSRCCYRIALYIFEELTSKSHQFCCAPKI